MEVDCNMRKPIFNMKNSSTLNKHCTNCGEYNESVDDPKLVHCPFCYSTLIKNYITRRTYKLDRG